MNVAVLAAVLLALGAVTALAQDPCSDAAGLNALDTKVRDLITKTDLESRKAKIESAKQFLEKYGNCESAKKFAEYLTPIIAKWEKTYRDALEAKKKAELTDPFDAALKAKDWDKVYSSGKQILQVYPDDFRTVEIVLASIGGEEALKNNAKYADDALLFAKQSIADLEAGKSFMVGDKTRYGLRDVDANKKVIYDFEFPSKEDALGWLNYYAGYITNVVKKDKVAALPYLYKATQVSSGSKDKPGPYTLIGDYYIAEGDKLADEIQALSKAQAPTDTEEVAKQKADAIKAKVALANGTSERAIDAFARALGRSSASDATYRANLKKKLDFSYNRRFGKMEGLDAWVANVQKQPFVNPTTPVTPISDPEPAPSTTTTTTTTPPAVKPGTTPAKPPTPTKPAAIPVSTTGKPQATVKKPVAKKKTT